MSVGARRASPKFMRIRVRMGKRLRVGGTGSVSQSLFRSIWARASAARTPLLAMSLTYWVPVSSFGFTPSRLPAGEGEVSSRQGGDFRWGFREKRSGAKDYGQGRTHSTDGSAH